MSNLGIHLKLPDGVANTMQQQRTNILREKQTANIDCSDGDCDAANEENHRSDSPSNRSNSSVHAVEIDDEDRIIMPFCPSGSENFIATDEDSQGTENKDHQSDVIDFDDLSLNPPENMPMLLLDLEKLCGYNPTDRDEIERVRNEIQSALLGDSKKNMIMGGAQKDNYDSEDDVALDFAARSSELFEAGIATHCTDSDASADNGAVIRYPEFLPLKMGQSHQPSSLVATKKLWKMILHPHNVEIVDKLLSLLSSTSRDLIWKYHMSTEIRRIVRFEEQLRDERMRKSQLRLWRKSQRPAELAKLYDVRETFEIRLQASKVNYDAFVREREQRVDRELRRRREMGVGTGGISGLDFNSKVTFGFGNDIDDVVSTMLIERTENLILSDDDYHDFAEDEHDESSENIIESDGSVCESKSISSKEKSSQVLPAVEGMPLPMTSKADRKKRRIAAATRRLRKKLDTEKECALASDLRNKIEQAYEEEESVRSLLISTDEKFTLSAVMSLEKHIEKIDGLLETLQEEEWKDEEEGLMDESSDDNFSYIEQSEKDPSILNSILAMILSALPSKDLRDPSKHYSYLKEEHQTIIREWKSEFGRLPRMDHDKTNVSSNREPVIYDFDDTWEDDSQQTPPSREIIQKPVSFETTNVPDDWEDTIDDWDGCITDINKEGAELATQKQLPSLRPGGRSCL
mmetsp:Transcript_10663/g.15545  ORF Transcript_10663/g.15545 Transcript_10663/m.15545 type:complete len:689 (+) Transcript_10663:172-2238(+)